MNAPRDASDDPETLLEVAARLKKQAKRKPAPAAATAGDEEMPDALFDELGEDGGGEAKRKPAKRLPLTDESIPALRGDADASANAAVKAKPKAEKAKPEKAEKPKARPRKAPAVGFVTKGVHAGLASIGIASEAGRRLGAWGIAAVAAAILVLGLTYSADGVTPPAAPIGGVRVVYIDGPRIPERDLLALMRGFPGARRLLAQADAETLAELGDWLREQPVVREVAQVRLVHQRDGKARTVEIALALREAQMPAVLATGARAWIDAEGRILPPILPAPAGNPRPVLRGIEAGGAERVREAIWLWSRLEKQLEPGLVTDIRLDDPLDLKDQRGIVLSTRQGSRLLWGHPDDTKFGIDPERKVRDLVHTIRCQGDLSRIATINVRFRDPVFTLR